MTDTTDIAVPSAARITQATAIEQSRAAAEVHAAIVVAQQCPRDVQAALSQMRQTCRMAALAERAFFRYARAGSTISGASVHLARELARCWGNIQYGIVELSRDDHLGESQMLAFAWDVETNARTSNTFIVPHKRDKRGGAEALVDLRDIYENNANNGARRVRECIFAVLPPWLTEEAKELCSQTIKDGGGKPLPQRVADVIAWYAKINVTEDDIVRKLGRPSRKWTEEDVAQLGVIYRSISRGEVGRDDEFPPPVTTAAEITASVPTSKPAATAPRSSPVADWLTEHGVTDHALQLRIVTALAGPVDTLADLDDAATDTLLATLATYATEHGEHAADALVLMVEAES